MFFVRTRGWKDEGSVVVVAFGEVLRLCGGVSTMERSDDRYLVFRNRGRRSWKMKRRCLGSNRDVLDDRTDPFQDFLNQIYVSLHERVSTCHHPRCSLLSILGGFMRNALLFFASFEE